MLLKDFLTTFIKNYDFRCKDFSVFYKQIYKLFAVFNPLKQVYGLQI